MHILITGDSLSLPRPHRINNFDPIQEKELAVHFNETYGYLLEKELRSVYSTQNVTVTNRAQRFSTIKNIQAQFWDHLYFFQPDVIIIQVGIVDCWFREDRGGKQLVDSIEFEQHYRKILSLLENRPETKVIVIGICPTSSKMEKRYPGILNQISIYNRILKKGVDNNQIFFLDMEAYVDPQNPHVYLLPDDHHLNKNGNVLIFRHLLEMIKAFQENIAGCRMFETDIEASEIHFRQSFKYYPYYGDNLYNLLYVSYLKADWGSVSKYIRFIRENNIVHPALPELITMIKEQIK